VACRGEQLARPGYVALIMAVVSIVAKEVLFRYTVSRGKAINSSAVIANAWHHRSDAISSLATLVGIFGAMFFGEHWRILDPIAAVVVSIFICIVAVKIGLPALRELLEVSLPISDVNRMEKIIGETPGVKAFHNLRTRKNGYNTIADFHIKVDADIRVVEAHDIATLVENRLKDIFGKYMIVNIHIEPYKGEKREQNGKVAD
jgi:cation diffusion facilitator family transporter